MIIPKFNCTQKFLYEVDELRAISGHMLGASRVQIPENNLDNLHSTVEDGTLEIVDPQELLGLDVLLSNGIGFLRGTIAVVVILVKGHTFPTNVKVCPVGCDPLALVSKFTPVEESTCMLETTFVEDVVLMGVFPDEGICSVNLIFLLLFTGVKAISLVPKSLMQGQLGKVEKGWNGGEVGEKCVAGISVLNATVSAKLAGKKTKQIKEHFHGLEKSLKSRFTELEIQEKEFRRKTTQSQQMLKKRQAAVMAKEEASLRRLQEKKDVAVIATANVLGKRKSRKMKEQGSRPIF
nr:FRIGIDA-like protein 3 [Tanacetum cinerariifolium]